MRLFTDKEIEDFITNLDHKSRGLCVFPEKQTLDCDNCYLCRVDYFNNIREELKEYGED